MIEWIKDKWLTWRTGKSKDQREWETWYEQNVVYRATTIPNMFQHFKHVILVDPDKFFDVQEPFAWVPCAAAKKYFWPERPVATTCVWRFERVIWDQWSRTWLINGLGDGDKVFVATNSDQDAVMITLKWS